MLDLGYVNNHTVRLPTLQRPMILIQDTLVMLFDRITQFWSTRTLSSSPNAVPRPAWYFLSPDLNIRLHCVWNLHLRAARGRCEELGILS